MSNKKKIKRKAPQKKQPDALIITLIVALAIAVIFMCISLIVMQTVKSSADDNKVRETAEFVPPSFDKGAFRGTPNVPEDKAKSYLKVYKDGMSFSAYVCGEVVIDKGYADIYFTNPEENSLWMKLRIFDSKGNVIGETGLIKPNEYIQTVRFDTLPENGEEITMKIMTYEPDTYYSGGAVPLRTQAIVKN